ncbi:MAG: hypothetical protein ACERKO_08030 [Acetanaerobacterium sp.]
MDVFIEYLVKRKSTIQTALLKMGIVVLGLVVIIFLFLVSPQLGEFSILAIAGAVGAGYGAWYLLTGFNVEFEYSLTNGEIDIDKIIAQRKRKRLITVVCRQVDAIGKYKPEAHAHTTYKTKIFACADEKDEQHTWYVVYNSVNFGKTLVVFDPPERMLTSMKPFLPRLLLNDLQRNGLM